MLSVLHVLSSLELGGAERFVVELAQFQRKEKLDAQILCLGSESNFLVSEVRNRKIPLTISEIGFNRFKRYIQILSIVRQFDAVHIHSRGSLRFISPLLPFFFRTKVIYTRHGLDPQNSVTLKLLYSVLRPFIHYITFVTKTGHDVFVKNHHWNNSKLLVIHNGIHVSDDYSKGSKHAAKNTIRFGSVGRMIALKGQSILLDATVKTLQSIKGSDEHKFVVNFFGSGPLETLLKEQSKTIGKDVITFFGEKSDLDEIYECIDVLVVASSSEGLSMVIIEAMARGIPVIATEVGGNPSLVYDGITGILIPYGCSKSMAEAMTKLIYHIDYIEKYGLAAQELIRSKFTLQQTHLAYLECYKTKNSPRYDDRS
ncbi:MAG: hypothetical protein COA96_03575 [SAR86 cluster bacterium]|uniref:Glycosyltransferase subfamily 4-like N-terminal domain-containing protein n=1 Tax=SAR86 cluster bacterium TaxID=2030880 RepID=A0A2A5B8E3_9GAMM|nr:MAG: hypothetical protein COA96_03575 [SAR86 cluster bacterium]